MPKKIKQLRGFKGHTKQLRKNPTMFFPTQTTTWFPLVFSIHAMKHKLYKSNFTLKTSLLLPDTNITSITYRTITLLSSAKTCVASPKKISTNAGSPVWVLINITCRSDMRTSPQLQRRKKRVQTYEPQVTEAAIPWK